MPTTTRDRSVVSLALRDRTKWYVTLRDRARYALTLRDRATLIDPTVAGALDILQWQVHNRDMIDSTAPLAIEIFD